MKLLAALTTLTAVLPGAFADFDLRETSVGSTWCGGGNRGTCYAWHDAVDSKTCAALEQGRISYSRVACKTAFFKGEDSIGA